MPMPRYAWACEENGMGNVIVIGVLLCVVGLAVRFLHRQKKQGGCCGECSHCGDCSHCGGCKRE